MFASHQAAASYKADQVLVIKSERMLYLQRNGESLRSYPVALGPVPRGHKRQQGDERTPEGHYVLDFKNAGSRFYKSIRISYPSRQDRLRASELGVDPGGDIMIHGQPATEQSLVGVQLFNWTDGCIAVTNEQMDEIWELVPLGTPIEIRP
ncbi:MAG TPA: L,D-transpeptidase family protein [Kineobactrum sp.]